MTSIIAKATRHDLRRLISTGECGNLTEEEIEKFNRFVSATTKLWVGFVDDKPICIYGLTPPTLCSDSGYLWLHTTKEFTNHVFIFVRHSQIVIEQMLAMYPKIVGHAEVGADKSIRWLKWLGAEFDEPVGRLIPFVIQRKSNG